MASSIVDQPAPQPNGRRVARPGHLPAEHGKLMAQDGNLNILRIGSRTAADHAEDPPYDQERQVPDHHGSRSSHAPIPLLTAAR